MKKASLLWLITKIVIALGILMMLLTYKSLTQHAELVALTLSLVTLFYLSSHIITLICVIGERYELRASSAFFFVVLCASAMMTQFVLIQSIELIKYAPPITTHDNIPVAIAFCVLNVLVCIDAAWVRIFTITDSFQ